jgi:hypothetical protein
MEFATAENVTPLAKEVLKVAHAILCCLAMIATLVCIALPTELLELAKTPPPLALTVQEWLLALLDMFASQRAFQEMDLLLLVNKSELNLRACHVLVMLAVRDSFATPSIQIT